MLYVAVYMLQTSSIQARSFSYSITPRRVLFIMDIKFSINGELSVYLRHCHAFYYDKIVLDIVHFFLDPRGEHIKRRVFRNEQ